jgi:hypothetical protein
MNRSHGRGFSLGFSGSLAGRRASIFYTSTGIREGQGVCDMIVTIGEWCLVIVLWEILKWVGRPFWDVVCELVKGVIRLVKWRWRGVI